MIQATGKGLPSLQATGEHSGPFPKGQGKLFKDSELGGGDRTRLALQMVWVAQWKTACRGTRGKGEPAQR